MQRHTDRERKRKKSATFASRGRHPVKIEIKKEKEETKNQILPVKLCCVTDSCCKVNK